MDKVRFCDHPAYRYLITGTKVVTSGIWVAECAALFINRHKRMTKSARKKLRREFKIAKRRHRALQAGGPLNAPES